MCPRLLEKCMFCQMSRYMDKLLSKHQYGFRKGYHIKHCISNMLEKWKSAVHKENPLVPS